MAKQIKILKVEVASPYTPDRYRVRITKRQLMKLPKWVRSGVLSFYDTDNPRHAYISIKATDELQAMMRFRRLWAGLATLIEEQ